MIKVTRARLALALLALVACGDEPFDYDIDPDERGFLASYCRGTLAREIEVKVARQDSGGWFSVGTRTLPAGTPLVLADRGDEAYGFNADGEVLKVSRDDRDDFVDGADIDRAGCASDPARERTVLLQSATLYATEDYQGAGCEVAAGEGFAGVSSSLVAVGDDLFSGDARGTFSGDAIQQRCGFSPAYGKVNYFDTLYLAP